MELATKKRRTKLVALAAGIGIASGLLASLPAFAEGSWSSSISGARNGFSSRSWQDSHLDSVATVTTFSGCTVQYMPTGFQTTNLQLFDEYGLLPDQAVATKANTCGTTNFGTMTRPDGYHWTITSINNNTGTQPVLSVSSVHQTY